MDPTNADAEPTARGRSSEGGVPVTVIERDRLIDLTVFDPPEAPAAPPAPQRPGSAVSPLVAALLVAGGLVLAVSTHHLVVVGVVAALAGMIFLHELGHFLTARATNTKATEFFVGFGPRIWSFRRGETEYGVKGFPIGGYVKILGMTNLDAGVAPEDEPRTYRQASYPKRVLMACAGTGMHLILAFVLFMVLFAGTGRLEAADESSPPTVNVSPGSPAQAAGLRAGDRFVSMNGEAVATWDQLRNIVQANADRPIAVRVMRGGAPFTTTVTPTLRGNTILIGVSLKPRVVREGVLGAVGESAGAIGRLVPQTFISLKSFFAPSNLVDYAQNLVEPPLSQDAKDKAERNRMLSPYGAGKLLTDAAHFDIRAFLELFASINVFVGLFNMLPILPLDGGHVLIATYERLRSRPRRGIRYRVDVSHWLPVTYAVMAVMLLLSVSSLYLDVRSPINIF